MPWFCHTAPKKKRSSNKTRVGVVGKLDRQDNALSSSSDRPSFAVILQSFTASLVDELSVQRGQVVEVMYFDGDWSFVRNMDSSSGYVPKMYCLSMDKVKGNFNNVSSNQVTGPLPRPRVINVDTLQRSGSSVNSVEVRQVMADTLGSEGSSNPIPIPRTITPTPSSSSQVIYEVPRSPVHLSEGSAIFNPPTVASSGTPSTTGDVLSEMMTSSHRAPSLPPRSANLPSQAEIQRYLSHAGSAPSHHRPAFLPGCRQGHNPFTIGMHSADSTSSSPTSRLTTPMQQPGSYSYSPMSQSPGSSRRTSSNAFSQSYPSPQSRLPPSGLETATPLSTNPFTLAQQQRHTPIINHAHSPKSIPHLGRRQSAPVFAQTYVGGGRVPPGSSPGAVANTPGSAGVPSVAPSPISARVAITPGANQPAVTPGFAGKPKFAVSTTPPGTAATPLDPNTRWPVNMDCTPGYKRVGYRRDRRHSSDNLTDLAISENSDVVSFSPPQTVSRHQRNRRQSQPCVATIGLQNSPPRRPTRLPVRRTLSMQEHSRVNVMSPVVVGSNGGGVSGPRTASVPIHRAASYQEAVLGEEERTLGATASIKPSEIMEGVGRLQPDSDPGSSERRRGGERGRGRSDRLDSTTSDTDDVFLPPGTKKPYGIFRCLKPYKQKFKGEISLEKDELVIVLDRGRGEWAWAITSNNTEGLIPKSVLRRYSPDHNGVGMVDGSSGRGTEERSDAETQTEITSESAALACESSASCIEFSESCVEAGVSCKDTSKETGASLRDTAITSCKDIADPSHNSGATEVPQTPHTSTPPPSEGNEQVSSNTQTSPKIGRAVALVSIDSLTTTDTSPVSTTRSNKSNRSNRSSSAHADAESSDTAPKEWFDTLDSVDAARVVTSIKLEHGEDQFPSEVPQSASSTQEPHKTDSVTIPPGVRKLKPTARKPTGIPRRKKAASCSSSLPPPHDAATPPSSASSPGASKPIVVKAGTVHYHDRISGKGSVRYTANPDSPSATPRTRQQKHRGMTQRPSTMLTAIKDYSPPGSSHNCLTLNKGDVLHSQPHMHYPKGWMWVWHSKQRCFGYVPKNYVAYTYDTPPRERHRTESVEDAV